MESCLWILVTGENREIMAPCQQLLGLQGPEEDRSRWDGQYIQAPKKYHCEASQEKMMNESTNKYSVSTHTHTYSFSPKRYYRATLLFIIIWWNEFFVMISWNNLASPWDMIVVITTTAAKQQRHYLRNPANIPKFAFETDIVQRILCSP